MKSVRPILTKSEIEIIKKLLDSNHSDVDNNYIKLRKKFTLLLCKLELEDESRTV